MKWYMILLFFMLIMTDLLYADIARDAQSKVFETVSKIGSSVGSTIKSGVKTGIGLGLKYNPIVLSNTAFMKATKELVQFAGTKYVLGSSSLYKDNPYKDKQAQVRIGKDLHHNETAYISRRKKNARHVLETFTGRVMNGTYIPTIATINSGGGTRALISMLGFHLGIQSIGLLDAVTYDVGLSGGSWFISLWQQSKKSVQDFKIEIKSLLKDGLIGADSQILTKSEQESVAKSLILRASLEQPVTLVNIWGALLAARYLKPYGVNRQGILFSNIIHQEDAIRYPFPILTAIDGNDLDATHKERVHIHWYEFTPYEIGGTGSWLGDIFVPTWAFGRKFDNAISKNNNPEYDLGLLMGIWGSAFGVSAARIYEELLGELGSIGQAVRFVLENLTDIAHISEAYESIALAKAHNFTRGIAQSPYKNDHKLYMCDAGIAFNLPYPPVSGYGPRSADILIFFDASGGLPRTGAEDLKLAEQYARKYHLKFPTLPSGQAFFDATTKSIAIFKDDTDPTVPLVIYFPLIKDPAVTYSSLIPADFNTDFPTMKFAYDSTTVDRLSFITQKNVEHNVEKIKEAIAWKINQQGGFKNQRILSSRPIYKQPNMSYNSKLR